MRGMMPESSFLQGGTINCPLVWSPQFGVDRAMSANNGQPLGFMKKHEFHYTEQNGTETSKQAENHETIQVSGIFC